MFIYIYIYIYLYIYIYSFFSCLSNCILPEARLKCFNFQSFNLQDPLLVQWYDTTQKWIRFNIQIHGVRAFFNAWHIWRGHICRNMEDTRLVINVIFGIMEGTSWRGRPNREWLDDIEEWCQENIPALSRKAQNRDLRRRTVNYAVNTNGQEPMEWWMDGWIYMKAVFHVDTSALKWTVSLRFKCHFFFVLIFIIFTKVRRTQDV